LIVLSLIKARAGVRPPPAPDYIGTISDSDAARRAVKISLSDTPTGGTARQSDLRESIPQRVQETVHFVKARAEPHERLGDSIVADVALASTKPARLSGLGNFLQLGDLALQNLIEYPSLSHVSGIYRPSRHVGCQSQARCVGVFRQWIVFGCSPGRATHWRLVGKISKPPDPNPHSEGGITGGC
jgi:hypothetical protein